MSLFIALDGTWSSDDLRDRQDDTNVGLLARAHLGRTHYYPGVGERIGLPGKLLGGAFALGWRSRLREAREDVLREIEHDPHPEVFICGWSRGSAVACHLTRELSSAGVHVRYLLLFDCVPSFTFGVRLGLPEGQPGLHLRARDERRWLFRSADVSVSHHAWLRGNHSDIGRGDAALITGATALRLAGCPLDEVAVGRTDWAVSQQEEADHEVRA